MHHILIQFVHKWRLNGVCVAIHKSFYRYIFGKGGFEMFEVVKRDGQVTEFNLGKINDAIAKAFDATQMASTDILPSLILS